jgi:hypothetical protein
VNQETSTVPTRRAVGSERGAPFPVDAEVGDEGAEPANSALADVWSVRSFVSTPLTVIVTC